MSTISTFNRRHFLGAAVIAVTSAGIGMSAITTAQIQHSNRENPLPIETELSSLVKANAWLNTQPLTKDKLRGKVVLIHFWTYTCINWMRTLPYVREWAASKYRDQGLVVIGVHTPEFSFEENFNNVRLAINDLRVDYPVAIDNNREIWQAFSNNYWPALYLIDAKGHIRYQHFGEGAYVESEKMIQKLLSETNGAGISKELTSVNAVGVETPADLENLRSPEIYLGHARTENFASPERVQLNKRKLFTSPSQLKLNQWALSGEWTMHEENIVNEKSAGRILYRFHARDVNLVMGPAVRGGRVRFRVLIDGIAPGAAHGIDIDENGNGTIHQQRMYQLIRQVNPIVDRLLEIEFLDAGAEGFSFTFG